MHSWNLRPEEATDLQIELAPMVVQEDDLGNISYILGVDVAYSKIGNTMCAAAVVLAAETLELVETAAVMGEVRNPYIPGLFAFRELPLIVQALQELKRSPDLAVCDGHGLAHPRRFGLASHLGVLFDVPTIGCAKNKLLGMAGNLGVKRGNRVLLIEDKDIVGAELRTQNRIKPVYVSIGHRISLATACRLVLQLSPEFRLPETTRQADQLAKKTLLEKGACF